MHTLGKSIFLSKVHVLRQPGKHNLTFFFKYNRRVKEYRKYKAGYKYCNWCRRNLPKFPTIIPTSSLSSCRAAITDIPDPLSVFLPIVHSIWQVFRAISLILTELLIVGLSWSSWFCTAICGVHRSSSLMSTSILFQQCPAFLVRLTWIVFVMSGRWSYNCCYVGCCLQDLFNIARSILV